MKDQKWILENENISNRVIGNWQIIYDFSCKINSNIEIIVLKIDENYTFANILNFLKSIRKIKGVIIEFDSKTANILNLLLNSNDFKRLNLPIIFVHKNNINLNHEERFQISIVYGSLALRKHTPNVSLRNYYRFQSYQIILENPNLSFQQKEFIDIEKNDISFSKVNKEILELNLAVKTLEKNGEYDGFDLGAFLKMSYSFKSSVKNILKPLINSKPKYNFSKIIDYSASKNPDFNITNPSEWKNVLITGWYGTETIGDKAILGEIIYRIRSYNPKVNIYVSSIDYRVSWQTRIEMDLDISIIGISKMDQLIDSANIDAIIMGGGPLMDSSHIIAIANAFNKSAFKGIQRVIFGCGVGPIHNNIMKKLISQIIQVSNVAFYRDEESLNYALELGAQTKRALLACDPALAFVRRWKVEKSSVEEFKKNYVTTLIRKQTLEYDKASDIAMLNDSFTNVLTNSLITLFNNSTNFKKLNLIAMHAYWRGNDDRILNNEILNDVGDNIEVIPNLGYHGLYKTLESLDNSKMTIAMRYHGHVFSIALNIPFLSIDYTGESGKVHNLMRRIGFKDKSIKFKEIFSEVLTVKLIEIEKGIHKIPEELEKKSVILEKKLIASYDYFWER